jgi:hypothetical protein
MNLQTSSGPEPIAGAMALFVVWTAVTWLLEGRIETFLRPDAVADRLVYALVANVGIGIVGAVAVIHWLGGLGLAREAAGFGPAFRTGGSVAAGAVIGFALYVIQGAPTLDPIILLNAFAQVLVVSVAEVLVCWAVIAATVEMGLKGRGKILAGLAGGVTASVLFGLYHYAHSAPFNTFPMVATLMVVGVVTGLYFFMSRDVYGTIVFHNFLGTFGVTQALNAAGTLDTMATLQMPLIVTALVAVGVLLAADHFLLK